MTFPSRIRFLTDDTEAIYLEEIVTKDKKADRSARYEFVKARVNKGKRFSLLLSQVEKLRGDKLIETE